MFRKTYQLLILLAWLPAQAFALEFYGVALENTSRDELRAAVKQAGAVVLQEAGDEHWFDIYDSSAVVAGSSKLFLGFVREDQRFAFAEYEFPGLNASQFVAKLKDRYGDAEISHGRFVSDRRYQWEKDGIVIHLVNDWQNYKTRLSYIESENLARLQQEKAFPAQDAEKPVSYF
ncbi:MAG: hypothetical protein AAF353_10195 [Pseudomonadota bacterium]